MKLIITSFDKTVSYDSLLGDERLGCEFKNSEYLKLKLSQTIKAMCVTQTLQRLAKLNVGEIS